MAVLTIGLTGGIGSGKSLAAATFSRLGVPVLDGDQAAREIVQPGMPALDEVFAAFGIEFRMPDGQLDRRRLRERVFGNPADRKRLEQITHPRIRQHLLEWRDRQTDPYCVLAVPILVESGLNTLVDRVLVVDCAESLQLQRLLARDGITIELARQMLAAQATRSQRLDQADDVLRNESDPAALDAAATAMHRFYLGLAASDTPRAPGRHLP